MRSRILRILEISTLVAGLALVAFFVAARLDSYFSSRAAVASFEASVAEARHGAEAARVTKPEPEPVPAATTLAPAAPLAAPAKVDFSLWSPGRVRAYRASLKENPGRPLALLKIPKIRLVVPVFEGTDELTLNRGVGRIEGTAFPGQPGNLGIAGHRDGFFRGLRNVSRGDVLELVGPSETATYVIDKIQIVTPKNVSVLRPGPGPELTLVTCYPFYYVGHAPKRFIVTGSLEKVVPNTGQRSRKTPKEALQGEKRK